jgi:hypothetical protein
MRTGFYVIIVLALSKFCSLVESYSNVLEKQSKSIVDFAATI